ncbi:hypothetical protein OAS47_00225 [Pelagibacteraceae bacterium]|nr:hypothetical protein [Pelagibacteraceae bacterium]
MSSIKKHTNYDENHYLENATNEEKKVNLNDLVKRLQNEKKKEKKNNLILSAAAISAVAVFGIILTL